MILKRNETEAEFKKKKKKSRTSQVWKSGPGRENSQYQGRQAGKHPSTHVGIRVEEGLSL